METVTLNERITDYVANRLSANDKADFEADMIMDKELEKEVAREVLRKMQIDYKIKEHIQKAESERIASNKEHKTQNICLSERIKQKWGRLLDSLSSN